MPNVKVLGQVSVSPQGDWVSSYNYTKLDLVRHQNASYLARQNNIGVEPNVSTNWQQYWMLLVQDGSGGGSGAVESVNGETGVVLLDAIDVGAVPEMPNGETPLINGSGQIDESYLPPQPSGTVKSVNNVTPNEDGNVELTAVDVGAVPDDQYPTNEIAGAVKINTNNSGLSVSSSGQLTLAVASITAIDIRTGLDKTPPVNYGERSPITPGNLDYAVKCAITGKRTINSVTTLGNQLPLTDEERASIKAWLGISGEGGGTQLYKHGVTGSFEEMTESKYYTFPYDSEQRNKAYIITTSPIPLTTDTFYQECFTAIKLNITCKTEGNADTGSIFQASYVGGTDMFFMADGSNLQIKNIVVSSFTITNDEVIAL